MEKSVSTNNIEMQDANPQPEEKGQYGSDVVKFAGGLDAAKELMGRSGFLVVFVTLLGLGFTSFGLVNAIFELDEKGNCTASDEVMNDVCYVQTIWANPSGQMPCDPNSVDYQACFNNPHAWSLADLPNDNSCSEEYLEYQERLSRCISKLGNTGTWTSRNGPMRGGCSPSIDCTGIFARYADPGAAAAGGLQYVNPGCSYLSRDVFLEDCEARLVYKERRDTWGIVIVGLGILMCLLWVLTIFQTMFGYTKVAKRAAETYHKWKTSDARFKIDWFTPKRFLKRLKYELRGEPGSLWLYKTIYGQNMQVLVQTLSFLDPTDTDIRLTRANGVILCLNFILIPASLYIRKDEIMTFSQLFLNTGYAAFNYLALSNVFFEPSDPGAGRITTFEKLGEYDTTKGESSVAPEAYTIAVKIVGLFMAIFSLISTSKSLWTYRVVKNAEKSQEKLETSQKSSTGFSDASRTGGTSVTEESDHVAKLVAKYKRIFKVVGLVWLVLMLVGGIFVLLLTTGLWRCASVRTCHDPGCSPEGPFGSTPPITFEQGMHSGGTGLAVAYKATLLRQDSLAKLSIETDIIVDARFYVTDGVTKADIKLNVRTESNGHVWSGGKWDSIQYWPIQDDGLRGQASGTHQSGSYSIDSVDPAKPITVPSCEATYNVECMERDPNQAFRSTVSEYDFIEYDARFFKLVLDTENGEPDCWTDVNNPWYQNLALTGPSLVVGDTIDGTPKKGWIFRNNAVCDKTNYQNHDVPCKLCIQQNYEAIGIARFGRQSLADFSRTFRVYNDGQYFSPNPQLITVDDWGIRETIFELPNIFDQGVVPQFDGSCPSL